MFFECGSFYWINFLPMLWACYIYYGESVVWMLGPQNAQPVCDLYCENKASCFVGHQRWSINWRNYFVMWRVNSLLNVGCLNPPTFAVQGGLLILYSVFVYALLKKSNLQLGDFSFLILQFKRTPQVGCPPEGFLLQLYVSFLSFFLYGLPVSYYLTWSSW
jgi:hypothetical protein